MNSPIIFCHYGNSKYLRYTLECVKITNRNKRVILLGDNSNRNLAKKFGIEHYDFEDFAYGNLIEQFSKSYRLIHGTNFDKVKNGQDWIRFAFRRWFLIQNFITKNNIKEFWHFDSDTMIVDELLCHEAKFQQYDITEQCHGNCMNGYISNVELVRKFLQKIIEIFSRAEFLNKLDYGDTNNCFNEMSAYVIFKEEEQINRIRLSTIINGETFDDLLCRSDGFVTEKLPYGEDVKKVFLKPNGKFFIKTKDDDSFARLISLNLSWLPIYVYETILDHVKNKTSSKINSLSQAPVPLWQAFKKSRKCLKDSLIRKKR